ncbi:MAG: hypothetical protein IKH12_05980, partial [Clostridia bacterium]|nr:hypothetical protein [Clostridia bacterium]
MEGNAVPRREALSALSWQGTSGFSIWRDTGGVGRHGERFPAKGTLPALPRRLRMTAFRAAAVSFNPDGRFSLFRAKERKSRRKKERKPAYGERENAVRVCDAEKRRFIS